MDALLKTYYEKVLENGYSAFMRNMPPFPPGMGRLPHTLKGWRPYLKPAPLTRHSRHYLRWPDDKKVVEKALEMEDDKWMIQWLVAFYTPESRIDDEAISYYITDTISIKKDVAKFKALFYRCVKLKAEYAHYDSDSENDDEDVKKHFDRDNRKAAREAALNNNHDNSDHDSDHEPKIWEREYWIPSSEAERDYNRRFECVTYLWPLRQFDTRMVKKVFSIKKLEKHTELWRGTDFTGEETRDRMRFTHNPGPVPSNDVRFWTGPTFEDYKFIGRYSTTRKLKLLDLTDPKMVGGGDMCILGFSGNVPAQESENLAAQGSACRKYLRQLLTGGFVTEDEKTKPWLWPIDWTHGNGGRSDDDDAIYVETMARHYIDGWYSINPKQPTTQREVMLWSSQECLERVELGPESRSREHPTKLVAAAAAAAGCKPQFKRNRPKNNNRQKKQQAKRARKEALPPSLPPE